MSADKNINDAVEGKLLKDLKIVSAVNCVRFYALSAT